MDGEVVVSKAIKYRDRVFRGATHDDAMGRLQKLFPTHKETGHPMDFGFFTSKNRYIDKKQANDLYRPHMQAAMRFERVDNALVSMSRFTYDPQNTGVFLGLPPEHPKIEFGFNPVDIKLAGEKMGLKHVGHMSGLHWFNDPHTRSTIAVKSEATVEDLATKLKESRNKFQPIM